jgi:hypothetical protein
LTNVERSSSARANAVSASSRSLLDEARAGRLELAPERPVVEADEERAGRDPRPLRDELDDLQLDARDLGAVALGPGGGEGAGDGDGDPERPAHGPNLADGVGDGGVADGQDGPEEGDRRAAENESLRPRRQRREAGERLTEAAHGRRDGLGFDHWLDGVYGAGAGRGRNASGRRRPASARRRRPSRRTSRREVRSETRAAL